MFRVFLSFSLAVVFLIAPNRGSAARPEESGDPSKLPTEVQAADVVELTREARKSVVVIRAGGRDGEQNRIGTGFVVSADGLVATNLHVIGEARPISVQLADGRRFDATAVHASDLALDLAIVRIAARDLPFLQLGNSDEVRDGQRVVVLGNPQGLDHSVVAGVVSGQRNVEGREMIQLAIPIEPGNSGGPVIDAQGKVIGIVTMKSAITANLGFAVRVSDLRALLDRPNPIPIARWMTIGHLDDQQWTPLFGARWQQRAGRILVGGAGRGFGGRSLCLSTQPSRQLPYEVAVSVKLDDEAGAAGLVFHSDGDQRHYGFYPSAGRLRLSRFDGPDVFTWNVLNEVQSEYYRAGDWNDLKVRLETGKILCYVNEHLVIESSDDRLPPGRVGLAKFRQTKAEFKDFQVAPTIASRQVPPEVIERVNRRVGQLPDTAAITPADLHELAEDGPNSLRVIRRRIEELQQQAAGLSQLASDIHTQQIAAQLAMTFSPSDQPPDLARAALLVSCLDNEELEVDAYLREIDRMAGDLRQKLEPDADDADRLRALDEYLFQENGFHGSRSEYYHRANSYLDRVIDDREGLPITLSVLYMELGRRIGLQIDGVGLPGHFVVRCAIDGQPQLVDVFSGGRRMSRQEAEQNVRELTGRTLREDDLRSATAGEIISRMLRNLLGLAQQSDDKQAMLRYLEAMVAVTPDDTGNRGMRAVLRFANGRRQAALDDLNWFLANEPPGVDLNEIRRMIKRFEGQTP